MKWFSKAAFLCLFMTVVVWASLSGCVKKSDVVTLKLMGWGDVDETLIIQKAIAEFNKVHPDVKVDMVRVPFGEYITKVLTQFSGNMAPDVMAVNAEQVAAFTERSILLNLTPFAQDDAGLNLKEFYPEAVDRYTVDGMLVAVPRDIAPVAVVYYNKKMFDEAKLPYPKDDWTRTEFLATAQKLVKKDAAGKTVQWGFLDEWASWDVWVLANSAKIVDDVKKPTRCMLDDPLALEAIQFRADLMYKYKVMPSPFGTTAMGGLGNSDYFINGSVAMFFSGIWKTPRFRQIKDFEWDTVEFPKGIKGKHGFPMSAAGYAVVKTCKNPQLAYELVKYLSGEVGQKYMAATGLTQPAMKTLADSPVFLDGQAPKSKKFLLDAVKDGTFRAMDSRADEWINIIGSAMDKVWSGDKRADEVIPEAVKAVNKKFYSK